MEIWKYRAVRKYKIYNQVKLGLDLECLFLFRLDYD